MTSSEGFQQHFSIISEVVCCGFYMKKNVALTLISFTVLKWDDCLSVQLPFELPVRVMVQLLLELEPNWLIQNVFELEFEKQPKGCVIKNAKVSLGNKQNSIYKKTMLKNLNFCEK